MVSRHRHGNTQRLLFSRLSGKTCCFFLFETCAVISGREVRREMSNKRQRRVCLWLRSVGRTAFTDDDGENCIPALSSYISVAVLWLLSLYVLCAQRASIWIFSIIRAVCKWTETEHKSNSSCSDENKTRCKASIFHSSSPVEDQNFVLDGFSLQASILPSPLWTQTASGEALGVWDMLGQTRVHGRVTADGWVREKTL